MSSETQQWLIVFLFFVGFFAFTIAETYWLYRKKGVSPGRAFGFSFASNIFAITVGFFISSLTFVAFLMLSKNDSIEVTPDGTRVAAGLIASAVVPFAVLVLAKWLLLRFLKITSVERPLVYSLMASIGFFVAVLILPFLVEYLSSR